MHSFISASSYIFFYDEQSVKCHEYSYLVLQPIEIFSVYFPAHKLSDSSWRWKSIADDETLKISAFLFMISMKI